jgi:hypothetical protein
VLKLGHGLVLTGWWACPNYNLVLNSVGSPSRLLRQKLRDGKCTLICNFFRTDGVLLDVRNRKEGRCAWSLVATTSRMLALSLLLLSDLVNVNLSLFVSNPCLMSLNSAFILFTPNQVYPLVRIYHRAISWRFHNRLPFSLLELVYCWFRASTLQDIGPLSSHVVMISLCLCVSIMFYHPREYHLWSRR